MRQDKKNTKHFIQSIELYEGGYRKFLDLVRGFKVRPGSLVYMVRSVKHHVYREDKAVQKEEAKSFSSPGRNIYFYYFFVSLLVDIVLAG